MASESTTFLNGPTVNSRSSTRPGFLPQIGQKATRLRSVAEAHDLEPKVAEIFEWARSRSDDKEFSTGHHHDRVVPILLARLIRDVEMMLPKLTAIEGKLADLEKHAGGGWKPWGKGSLPHTQRGADRSEAPTR
jgi:hypothetical protein